jgi:MoaA/NifB/PqqE/SkfB family radical SAM enzyme
MNLENIGFYTLSDDRAKNSSDKTPLHRCELLLTKRCNFRCPYCRGTGPKQEASLEEAQMVVSEWAKHGLKNVRFSGGEPTVWPHLVELIKHTKSLGVERIAISSNGSASKELYKELCDSGVNDFSISLDACCSSTGDTMSGVKGAWNTVVENIKYLSTLTYVTVGVVLTNNNIEELGKIIEFAHKLGVADIRIISAAQVSNDIILNVDVSDDVKMKHPILMYRLKNLSVGRNVRGLKETDTHKCPLVLDDMAVMDGKHYPCIIYMREGGAAIGEVGPNMRQERLDWFNKTDTHKNKICKNNCLDVCQDFNNKWEEFRKNPA